MAEREIYERTIERLCGEVDALRALLLTIAELLPERAMYCISNEAARLRNEVDRDAAAKPNDRRREYSAGFWDTACQIEVLMGARRDELREGHRIPIIQQAPIPDDRRDLPES